MSAQKLFLEADEENVMLLILPIRLLMLEECLLMNLALLEKRPVQLHR